MASKLGLRLAPATCRLSIGAPIAQRRAISSLVSRSSSRNVVSKQRPAIPISTLSQSFRRAYADAPQVTLSPPAKPKKRYRFFRWAWRITYLSVLGGTAYFCYLIYDLRNPAVQIEADSKKKTLVILGQWTLPTIVPSANSQQALVGELSLC